MNERIIELAEQAGFENGHQDRYGNSLSQELEQFAELIVRECAELFPQTFTDERYQRRIDKTIKKHFGV